MIRAVQKENVVSKRSTPPIASILGDQVVEVVERGGRIAEGAEDAANHGASVTSRTDAIGNASDCTSTSTSDRTYFTVSA